MLWCNPYRQSHTWASFPRLKRANAGDLSSRSKAGKGEEEGWAVERYTMFLNTWLSALSIPVPWRPPAAQQWAVDETTSQGGEGRRCMLSQSNRGQRHSSGADGSRRGVHRAGGVTFTPTVSIPRTAGPGCQGRVPP